MGSFILLLFVWACYALLLFKAGKSSQAPGAAATRNKSEARIKGGGAVMSTDYVGGGASQHDVFSLSLFLPVRLTLLCLRKVRPMERRREKKNKGKE